ncbi:hypothetical protein D3C85_1277710 [compost metagenome]
MPAAQNIPHMVLLLLPLNPPKSSLSRKKAMSRAYISHIFSLTLSRSVRRTNEMKNRMGKASASMNVEPSPLKDAFCSVHWTR